MINVGILGGAFDPVTVGHVAVAKFVLGSGLVDSIWVTPCYRHLYAKKMAPAEHRLTMCRRAFKSCPGAFICDYEIKNELNGECYTLISSLLGDTSLVLDFKLSFILGMDNAITFDKWFRYRDLKRMVQFIVVPRTGVDTGPANAWYHYYLHKLLLPPDPLPETSSTSVREQLLSGKRDGLTQLDPDVLDYINSNQLYTA